MKPIIGITMGDFNGIGPEVALKAIQTADVRNICHPVLIGSLDVFEWYAKKLRMRTNLKEAEEIDKAGNGAIDVINIRKYHQAKIAIGKVSKEAGAYAGEAIESAIESCLKNKINAMVTAPVSKEAMNMAGYKFPGQTEMLYHFSKSKKVMMMLIAGKFRVGLVSIHVPINKINEKITKRNIAEKLTVMHESLKNDFGILSPKIAVLGLNPHAGEHGMIGKEEQTIISPAIRDAFKRKINVEGSFPADGFFGKHAYQKYDAVLAMYHDQGLIPLKMMGFDIGVNYSAGLSLVRTSPDHGTAFDIAGKGIAQFQSMVEAIKLAVTIVKNRRRALA